MTFHFRGKLPEGFLVVQRIGREHQVRPVLLFSWSRFGMMVGRGIVPLSCTGCNCSGFVVLGSMRHVKDGFRGKRLNEQMGFEEGKFALYLFPTIVGQAVDVTCQFD